MKITSTKSWFLIHLVIPIFPLIFLGFIKIVMAPSQFSISTFSSSTIALSIGLLSIFIKQSITRDYQTLNNEDKEEEVKFYSGLYLIITLAAFTLFGIIECFDFATLKLNVAVLSNPTRFFQIFVFGTAPLYVVLAIVTQKKFNLRANLQ